MVSKGGQLRELLNGPGVVIMPGVYDGFSARLVEAAGFLAARISGAGLSETKLGWPDVGIMGYDANLKASSDLAACTSIPLLADGDSGYFQELNELVGLEAIQKIEDSFLTAEQLQNKYHRAALHDSNVK
jgi:2-methylisocitrate lyase-like PEP mutase family enzyme